MSRKFQEDVNFVAVRVSFQEESKNEASRVSGNFKNEVAYVLFRAFGKFQEVNYVVSRESCKFQEDVHNIGSKASLKFQEDVSYIASRVSGKFQEDR